MPLIPTYPGVYIEGLPSAARTVTGVSTSVTAFLGCALKGPLDKATLIHGFSDYVRIFGGLWKKSNMSYVVNHYFMNGGNDAIIVRVGNGANEALFGGPGGLILKASTPGSWGRNLEIAMERGVDEEKLESDKTLFNITAKIVVDGKVEQSETYFNLSADTNSQRFVTGVLEEESSLIRVVGNVPHGQLQHGGFELAENSGCDGNPLTPKQIIGDPLNKTGMYALDIADIFNFLCIPSFDENDDTENRVAAYRDALTYCEKRRAMLVVDPPKEWNVETGSAEKAKAGIDNFGLKRNKNAAIFFPRISAPDPMDDNRLGDFDPCGAVAGVIARMDKQRGVWKAPAGLDATLMGVEDLAVHLTDDEIGELNASGINCLRILPAGPGVWGARTMRGKDSLADEWKYLSVRRTALYIEESLYRGTAWVVFEPNDEKMWSQVRLNVGAFLRILFLKGAFQGTDPKGAYFVKCDSETTTPYDVDNGIVNIIVGFAPLKPAEFVVIKIQQMAGQG